MLAELNPPATWQVKPDGGYFKPGDLVIPDCPQASPSIPPADLAQLEDMVNYNPVPATDHAANDPRDEAGITRATILAQAGAYVSRDRNANYGNPEDNFETIALLMSAYLSRRFGIHIPIRDYDVSPLMDTVKLARLGNNPLHHDSYVDQVGYGSCGGEVAAKARARGEQPSRLRSQDLIRYLAQEQADLQELMAEIE